MGVEKKRKNKGYKPSVWRLLVHMNMGNVTMYNIFGQTLQHTLRHNIKIHFSLMYFTFGITERTNCIEIQVRNSLYC